jgi:dipeptidyl-peptidase-4
MASPAQEAAGGAQPLTLERIFAEGGIAGRGPETIRWSPDGSKVSFVLRDDAGEHGELYYLDVASGKKEVLVSEAKLGLLAPPDSKIKDERAKEWATRYHVAAYHWAPDSQHLLFDSQGQLWLFDLNTGTGIQFTSAADPSQDPKFAPDGKSLAFVRKHNLYVRSVPEGNERQLTKDTEETQLNGEVDWVYAEELSVRSNWFWSPDGKEIAFLHTDESKVPTYPITDWLPTHPTVEMEHYPKAGDPNPVVRLGVVEAGSKPKWFELVKDAEFYVPRFGWLREGWLWAQTLNRTQDTMDLFFVDVRSGKSRKVLTETVKGGWVEVNDDFRILKSGDRFLWTSWRDGHTHIYLYSFDRNSPLASDAKLERQLEQGDYEVLGIAGVDEAAGSVYFRANKEDIRQQQVFAVGLDGSGLRRLSTREGTHAATFAPDGKHYVENYSSMLTPPQWSVCAVSGECAPMWQSHDVSGYNLRAPGYLEFKADDGTTLYGELLLPPQVPQGAKVPLIVHIYGGPAGQLVRNAWGGATDQFQEILARRGYAIFTVDNRGTPNRGLKFSTATRRQSGGVELKDQLTALIALLAKYPQLDRSRVGMWGWSNGGSMTLYSLTHSDAFKAGISVAPVTDWHNYDSIYTERYMGLPKDNAAGYEVSSIPKAAKNLHGSLLLVHGTSDDNVHMQNSIQMVDELIKSGQQFRLMFYPNKTHGISGAATRTQLFHMMQDFWDEKLK